MRHLLMPPLPGRARSTAAPERSRLRSAGGGGPR